MAGDLQSQRVGQVFDAGLGSVVRAHAGRRRERRQRRDDQHVALAPDHCGQRGAHGVEYADQVDVDDPLERQRINLQHRSVARDAGVGHHDVDTAEFRDRLLGGGVHRGQVANIGDHGEDPLVAAEFAGDRRQRGRIHVGQHQLGALGVQAAGHLGADPVGTAGDEYDLRVN